MSLRSILMIEDSDIKDDGIAELIEKHLEVDTVVRKESYQSGMCALEEKEYDLIILDMTLPTYDVTEHESGYAHLDLGGKIIIEEIARLKINAQVIVVTQYKKFVDITGTFTREELDLQLLNDFPGIYLGSVYFDQDSVSWRDDFLRIINQRFEDEVTDN